MSCLLCRNYESLYSPCLAGHFVYDTWLSIDCSDFIEKKTLHTKYGNAKISNGYYVITSGEEGNYGKYLHRLIAADYFGDWINNPDDRFDIHHIDGDKTNNCVLNLEPMKRGDHQRLHNTGENNYNYGGHLSEEHKKKISENHADVSKEKNPYWKNYARIVKCGLTNYGKQCYCLKFNGKRIKQSVYPDKLLNWFTTNYPLEIIKLGALNIYL